MSPTPATRHKGEAVLQFRYQAEWAQWLAQHHAGKTSVLRTHRKELQPDTRQTAVFRQTQADPGQGRLLKTTTA